MQKVARWLKVLGFAALCLGACGDSLRAQQPPPVPLNRVGTGFVPYTGATKNLNLGNFSLTAAFLFGDGSGITNVPSGPATTVPASGVLAGNLGTNVVARNVASGAVDFSTITTAIGGKLSNTAPVPNALIDLSTITTALAGKLATTGTAVAVASGGVDFSTITTALAGKLATNGTAVAVAAGGVDFSTITTALAGKLATTGTAVAVASGGVDFSTITTVFNTVAVSTTANAASIATNTAKFITNSSSMTNTSAEGLLVTSSVTAGAFFGDVSHATGYVIITASATTNGTAINSTTDVGITTNTTVLRGSRPLLVHVSFYIDNEAGAGRTYKCQLSKNSVLQGTFYEIQVGPTNQEALGIDHFESSSTAGSISYALLCNTSNVTGTQTANSVHLIVQEF